MLILIRFSIRPFGIMTNNSSCTNIDNEITFANRDHLDWHQKKQEIILNLGLANNSENDQTPTPTRLIRNCEEVGLFQDLQIVNPFDEVFKKAVENGNSINLQVPISTSDDTLHTPQIDPQLEETSKFKNNAAFAPNEYSFSGVISNIDQRDDGDNPLVIALDQDKDKVDETSTNCEDRTKISLQSNSPQCEANSIGHARQIIKSALIKKSCEIFPVPIKKLLAPIRRNSEKEDQWQIKVTAMLRQREANKAAQSRCRKRKQKEFENMRAENKRLKNENMKLRTMNLYLQETVKKLQGELKEARPSNSDPSGNTTAISENQSCVQEKISLSVEPINKKILCNQKVKSQVVSLPIIKEVPSSEGTPLQNTRNSMTQCSSALQNPILTSHITPLVLNKQANIDSNPKPSLKPLPIAPKNVSTVVFVYPHLSPPIILPTKPIHVLNDSEKSKGQKIDFRKIIPK